MPPVSESITKSEVGDPIMIDFTIVVLDMQAAYTTAAALKTPQHASCVHDCRRAQNYRCEQDFTPGVYAFATGVAIYEDLTFDGRPNDVFVIQTTRVLSIAAEKKVITKSLD
jgi:hypothetical protein